MTIQWIPIDGTVPQATISGNQANGMVLKFYEVGTLTPLSVATDSTGSTRTTEFVLNTQGYTTLSTVVVLPHVSTDYKIVLYLDQTDADANDTANAVYIIDNISLGDILVFNGIYDNLADALAGPDEIGDFIRTFEYLSGSGVGSATYKVVGTGTGTPDGGSFINKTDGSGDQLQLIPFEGKVFCTQWGTVADGTTSSGTDNGPKINAAITYARANRGDVNTVILPQGPLSIQEPIEYPQSINVLGYGTNSGASGGTELICNYSAGTISTPPTNNYTDRYSPVLAFTPMFYNTELITQQSYGNFRLNGNNKDVYGIYLNEFFFSQAFPIFVINCNKYPVTMLVGQQNTIELLTANLNKQGVRFVGIDSLDMAGLDTEDNTITGSQLDFVQDANFSTKGGNVISTWHFEEKATLFPTIFAKISGRNLHIVTSSFGTSGTPAERFIEILGAEAYSFDNVNITTSGSSGTRILGLSASAGSSLGVQFNSGASGSYVRAQGGMKVTDNSGNVTNQVDAITTAQSLPRGVTVESSTGTKMLHFQTDNKVNFFDSNNRYIEQSGANLNLKNDAGQITLTATNNLNLQGALVDFDAGGLNAGRFDANTTATNTRLLIYDVDNGQLERVSVGGFDSAGSGFKILKIPN